MKIPNKVIVIAFNTFNSYGIVRSLGEGGIKPYLILDAKRIPFVEKSKWSGPTLYFNEVIEIPLILKTHFVNEKYPPIIICCDDPIQAEIDSYYDELSLLFILSNCNEKQGEIGHLMNKDIQIVYAKEAGLTVPKGWHIPVGGSVPDDMMYPCIVKPFKSIVGSKDDICICYSRLDLQKKAGIKDFIVQQFIEKDYEIILWGTSIGNGEFYIPGVTRKIRQFPNEWGMSSYCVLESFDLHPKLSQTALFRFFKSLSYQGMFSIEMAVKDGKYYFLEINLRNDGKQYFSTAAGANLPLLYIHSIVGIPFKKPNIKLPTFAMGELTDFHQVLRNKVSLGGWIKDLLRTKCFFILNFGDLKPFVYQQWKQRFK